MHEITKTSLRDKHANRCIHFNGVGRDTCKAGVNYLTLVGSEAGMLQRMPCTKSNNSPITCEHCHYPTEQEVEAYVTEMEAHHTRQAEDSQLINAAHDPKAHQSVVFVCQLCPRESRSVFTEGNAFVSHVVEDHGIERETAEAAKGKRGIHSDAREWFEDQDFFSLPDGRDLLIRATRIKRRGANKAVW